MITIKKKYLSLAISIACSLPITTNAISNNKTNFTEKPNILVVVVDDMGYSDISPFGGEIPTPNLQKLAAQGLSMGQFYTSPMSAPSRSMLMTGNTNQQAGVGAMWWFDNTIGKDGYELHLTDRIITMPERFHDAGYSTFMAGKWHLGYTNGSKPTDRGFDHAFALMGGGASHFSDSKPLGREEAFQTYYTLDGNKISLPSNFYSSEYYANKISNWIKETPTNKPFFAYLAFTAPHDPLQAPEHWIKKFNGKYDKGYEPIYENRLRKLKKLGFITDKTPLPKLELDKAWNKLSHEEQKYEAKTMQVYAAMIANMDQQFGKVMKTLRDTGRDKNTIIVFLSDNGANAAPAKHYDNGIDNEKFWNQFDNTYKNIGLKNSFISIDKNWANISNAPHVKYHKGTSSQGGINTTFIISAPSLKRIGKIDNSKIAVYDIAPTLYDFAGIDPNKNINNKKTLSMIGISFKNYLTGKTKIAPRKDYAVELHNQATYIEGDWKLRRLVQRKPVADMAPWELFNLKSDPLETKNLADKYPNIVKKLTDKYNNYAKKTMIIEAKGKVIKHLGIDEKTGKYINTNIKAK